MEFKTTDLLKYVTVYHGAYDMAAELIEAMETAPHGDGYILGEHNEWEDQDGLRRFLLHEQYETNLDIDYDILGGPIFKSLSHRFPEDKIKSDDNAYKPVARLLDIWEEVEKDYLKRWNLDINIIQYSGMEFRYYNPPQDVGFHTDYMGYLDQHPWRPEPSEEQPFNICIAQNAYLNSDYGDGGALCIQRYEKDDKGNWSSEGMTTDPDYPTDSAKCYRPQAGDFIFFPSAWPYEHWVTKFEEKRRYMVNLNAVMDSEPTWQFN